MTKNLQRERASEMSDVVDRLTGRLDAMEAAAKAAQDAEVLWAPMCDLIAERTSAEVGWFVFDQSPAAVLAMVAGLRVAVALHPEMLGWCQGCAHESHPCRTLLAIAACFEASA